MMAPEKLHAFPLMGNAPEDGQPIEEHGLLLIDYFAAKAMQALINANTTQKYGEDYEVDGVRMTHLQFIAKRSYSYAAFMMEERKKIPVMLLLLSTIPVIVMYAFVRIVQKRNDIKLLK